MRKVLICSIFIAVIIVPYAAFAGTGDLFLLHDRVKFSHENFLEGKTVRIYATADSGSTDDLRGVIKFFDGDSQIQGDQPISVLASKEDAVFVDFTPEAAGTHNIKIILVPFEAEGDNPANNSVEKTITVFADSDRDGVANSIDSDDDGDGVLDDLDAFPLNRLESTDSDGDGQGNNSDPDDDNDRIPDSEDAFPLNPQETKDTDKDGIGDKQDVFPQNPLETQDYDKDGVGDNGDSDADNDGITKAVDTNDTNLGPVINLTSKKKARRKIVLAGDTVNFETIDSVDPDGKIATSEISLGEKKYTGEEIRIPFEEPGANLVSVKLTDDKGESREEKFKVYVIPRWSVFVGGGAIFLIIILAILLGFSYSRQRK